MQIPFKDNPAMSSIGRNVLFLLLRALCLATPVVCTFPAFAGDVTGRLTAQQFRDDIAFVRTSIAGMHPDPGFSTDPGAIDAALDRLGQDVPPGLSVDEAWQRLATINPTLADAHFFIGYRDWRADTRRWLDSGGSLFPVEVDIGPGDVLLLRAAPLVRVLSVNGVATDTLVSTLAAKVHGDTPGFRANLLARRWWLFYWKTFGAPARYRLVLDHQGERRTVDLPGSRALPRILQDEALPPFRFVMGPDRTAVLTVTSFSQPDTAPFLDFTRQAFERLQAEGATALEIDISENGGGDDAVWLDGLMPYLASRPYRTGSTYRAMSRPEPGKPATVSEGEIATWRQPQAANPLRFDGKVTVRIGPATYSSAILFANVVHDFGFGTLVGPGGWARRTQSGGVRSVVLPHTGLALFLPRFILDPPAGRAPGALLVTGEQHFKAAANPR